MQPRPLPSVEELRELFHDTGTQLVRRSTGQPATTLLKGYLQIRIGKTRYAVHRLLRKMRHGDEPRRIDHHDGDKLNNTDDNLRPATASQNGANSGDRAPGSGHKNVYAARDKWRAGVRVDGVVVHGPSRAILADAIADADELRRKYFGEFAYGGVPSNS